LISTVIKLRLTIYWWRSEIDVYNGEIYLKYSGCKIDSVWWKDPICCEHLQILVLKVNMKVDPNTLVNVYNSWEIQKLQIYWIYFIIASKVTFLLSLTMSHNRKRSVLSRLQKRLQEKSESLADQFDFCVYIAYVLKSPKKVVLYRSTEVVALMNNKFEHNIKSACCSHSSSEAMVDEHLSEDIVQLHISTYSNVKKDGCLHSPTTVAADMNFLIHPRNDVDHVRCVLLSRWKDTSSPPPGGTTPVFRCVQQSFCISSEELQRQIKLTTEQQLSFENLNPTEKNVMISDSEQRFFLLVEKQPNNKKRKNKRHCFMTKRLCLFLPQSSLTSWTTTTEEDVINSFYMW